MILGVKGLRKHRPKVILLCSVPVPLYFRAPPPFLASTIHQLSFPSAFLMLNLKTPLIFFTSAGPS